MKTIAQHRYAARKQQRFSIPATPHNSSLPIKKMKADEPLVTEEKQPMCLHCQEVPVSAENEMCTRCEIDQDLFN